MSANSKIEWCDHTFNPWTGCAKVSPGCANCYAESWSKRSGIVQWGPGKPRRRTSEANWKLPRRWNKISGCFPMNPRPRVFCASLADWLDNEVPIEWLADLLALIRRTPNLDWLLLTKRPLSWPDRLHRVTEFLDELPGTLTVDTEDNARWWHVRNWLDGDPPANVWIGTTAEDQQRADERIPALLDIPARVRFLSCEPLLEEVDLSAFMGRHCTLADTIESYNSGIHWIIVGGESGPKCRPFDPAWARRLRMHADEGGAAFFMKQMGGVRKPFAPIPEDLMIRQFPEP